MRLKWPTRTGRQIRGCIDGQTIRFSKQVIPRRSGGPHLKAHRHPACLRCRDRHPSGRPAAHREAFTHILVKLICCEPEAGGNSDLAGHGDGRTRIVFLHPQCPDVFF